MSAKTPSLGPQIESKRILICVGAGGVGKTTTAAALGLLGSGYGRKTLVMTIDPARRLAVSLGLQGGLDHHERAVPAQKMQQAGLAGGLLFATMLDQKQTFDEMVRRRATDAKSLQRVLANKLYQEISTRLAGGQEYAAMEKLYELSQSDRYDLLVLDTPPAANALDFLDAPQKMVDLIESPTINLFVKSYRTAGRFSFNVLSAGAAFVFRRLARFIGGGFLNDIAEFFADFRGLFGGVKDRAQKVLELLTRSDVGFVIVTCPDYRAIDEAIGFHQRLVDSGMVPAGFVINRVHTADATDLTRAEVAQRLTERKVDVAVATDLARAMERSHQQVQVLAQADAQQIQRLKECCGSAPLYVEVPLFDEDIYDIGGIHKLGSFL